jgi:hypothetical protein
MSALVLLTPVMPIRAMDDDTKKILAGAAAIAGIAALAHSQHHHDDGKHHKDEQREAEFERGYRDGLQNARFNDYSQSKNYAKGYDAGMDERQAHIYHNQPNRWQPEQHAASNYLQHRCALAVADRFDVGPNHVTPLDSKRLDKNEYKIKLRYGHHRHAVCRIREDGRIEHIANKD